MTLDKPLSNKSAASQLPAQKTTASGASGQDRKAALYLQHPEEAPELEGPLPYLIHPPSKLSSTSSWISFREKTLLPLIQDLPDDPISI